MSGLASIGIGAGGNDIAIANSVAVNVSGAGATGIGTLFGNATITNTGSVVVDGVGAVGIARLAIIRSLPTPAASSATRAQQSISERPAPR